MPALKLKVKWNGKVYSKVQASPDQEPVSAFATRLYGLTNVPPDHQKYLYRGKVLHATDDWSAFRGIKSGMTIGIMGAAEDAPASLGAPPGNIQFEEDLTVSERRALDPKRVLPAGLVNLQNTCYMNSVLQMLLQATPLHALLATHVGAGPSAPVNAGPGADVGPGGAGGDAPPSYGLVTGIPDLSSLSGPGGWPGPGAGTDASVPLPRALHELVQSMSHTESAVRPEQFHRSLIHRAPQFGERGPQGMLQQHDAQEFLILVLQRLVSTLTRATGTTPAVPGLAAQTPVQRLFQVRCRKTFTCIEDPSEPESNIMEDSLMLNCFVGGKGTTISTLEQGMALGLQGSLEKHAARLGRNAEFATVRKIIALPQYLFVHLNRFFWKETEDGGIGAKVLRHISFPMTLNLSGHLVDDLKSYVSSVRAYRMAVDATRMASRASTKTKGAGRSLGQAPPLPPKPPLTPPDGLGAAPAATYELIGVVTHIGRSSSSGHYIGWARHADGGWLKFDDDKVSAVYEEDIQKLAGGSAWHTAYLLLYRALPAQALPEPPEAAGAGPPAAGP